MKKFFLRLTILLILVTTVGLGCKGLTAEEKASIRPVTLNYWTVYGNVESLQKMAIAYKRIRPYVTINVKQVRPEEFESMFINALADDVAPDIISINTRDLRKYSSRLTVMPKSATVSTISVKGKYFKETVVDSQVNPMPTAQTVKSSYVSTVWKDVSIGNDVYGLPLGIDTLAVYYNKDLLDKAGVPLPPANWDEFIEAIKKSTKYDKDGKIIQSGVALGTGANIENVFDIVSLLMMQKGLQMADGSSVTFASGVSERASAHPALEALRFYSDFARPNKVVYSWNATMDRAFDNFVRGKSVFYFGFAYDRARLKARAPQLNIEVMKVPQLSLEAPVNVANYSIEGVTKKSKHQNEAWDFVRFMSTPENVKQYASDSGILSPLRSHVAEQTKDPMLAPFAEGLLSATNWYRGKNYSVAVQAFRDMAEGYLAPYGEGQDEVKRDANLIEQAASLVGQTM